MYRTIGLLIAAALLGGPCVASMHIRVNRDAAHALGVEIHDGSFGIATNSLSFGRSDLEFFSGGLILAGHYIATAIPGTQKLELFDKKTGETLLIQNAHIGVADGNLHILNADITVVAKANATGILSRVQSLVVGELFISTPWVYTPPPALAAELASCPTNYGPNIDVQLTEIDSFQQVARSNSLVALSMLTKLVNVGLHDVPWFWAIEPPGPIMPVIGQHPFAVFNLYQERGGIFRQIGKSDVKHAFYSTNTDCDCPGAQIIFSGCADIYGVANNANQFYFGPRSEVHALNGQWNAFGSHFDVTAVQPTPDNFRSHSVETDALTHRLVVDESQLLVTDAVFFVESWYLVQGDTNTYNNMGYRRVVPFVTNGLWMFTNATPFTNGPAIDTVALRDSTAERSSHHVLDTREGLVHVTATVLPLGNGVYRYGYSVMNLNYDRQIRAFSIPVSPGAVVSNMLFYDSDQNSTNDWPASESAGWLTWNMSGTNGLSWGTLFSFAVDANIPPVPSHTVVSSLNPSAGDSFPVPALSPSMHIASMDVGTETHINWMSISNAVYDVEYNGMMVGSGWQPLGQSVTARNSSVVLIDTNEAEDHMFYRLKLLSAP